MSDSSINEIHCYSLYGVTFKVNRPCPYLPISQAEAKVTVVEGVTPAHLSSPLLEGARYEMNEAEFLLKVDHVACFYVKEGEQIVIEPVEGVSWDMVCLYLYSSVFSALLRQRGSLVLRASTVADAEGRGMLLMGPSGIGKSMLASQFIEHGYRFVSDDIGVVNFVEGAPFVYPGARAQRLWLDACQHFNWRVESLKRVGNSLNKFWVDRSEQSVDRPVPVQRAVVMDFYRSKSITAASIVGAEKVREIDANVYHRNLIDIPNIKRVNAEAVFKLAGSIQCTSLKRFMWTIDSAEMVEALSK